MVIINSLTLYSMPFNHKVLFVPIDYFNASVLKNNPLFDIVLMLVSIACVFVSAVSVCYPCVDDFYLCVDVRCTCIGVKSPGA